MVGWKGQGSTGPPRSQARVIGAQAAGWIATGRGGLAIRPDAASRSKPFIMPASSGPDEIGKSSTSGARWATSSAMVA